MGKEIRCFLSHDWGKERTGLKSLRLIKGDSQSYTHELVNIISTNVNKTSFINRKIKKTGGDYGNRRVNDHIKLQRFHEST